MTGQLFRREFLEHLKFLIQQHHFLYSRIPPQGIFFEALVERAFRQAGLHPTQVVPTTPNAPQEDLQIGRARISLKTETGSATHPDLISITKLCTTERDPWDSVTLIQRVLDHLSRYDHILMLRAVHLDSRTIRYQLLDIPVDLLRLMGTITLAPVGRRMTRKSLAGDVYEANERVYHVHFDGTDGKCQIQRLLVRRCQLLLQWDHYISD